jgi:hypothetical protein
MKSIIVIIFSLLITSDSFGQSTFDFSREEVLADLEMLYESLEETHYDLYAYTTEQAFDSAYAEVKTSINKDSLSLLEATSTYQRLISVINNGHTEIPFPGESYSKYAYAGGTLFPLEIAFEYDKPLVRKNWSNNEDIEIGSEVLSINGMPMEEILNKIYPQISAERRYFKHAKIELYSFPRLYWQVFGQQDNFDVEIQSDGSVQTYSLNAINLIDDYEMKRSEVVDPIMELKFIENSAYLNPGGFGGEEEKYQQFIDSSFVEIKQKSVKNLIIDLRNNPGGNDSFSDYLVSYIADRPFKWHSSFTLKTSQFLKDHVRQHNDTTDVYWQEVLNHENGEIYEYEFNFYQPQPKEKRFDGNIYVLINRQSHSQSAVTAAQIQDYGFGTIVGEETGEYPTLYASQFQFTLPNTGIPVMVSKGYMVRVNGNTKEEGVIPDIFIKDYLLDEEDEILDGLLERIDGKS